MEEQRLVKRKRKALTDGNKLLLINTCIQLAELHFKEGRYQQAIAEYKIVAEKYKEADKLLDYARANRMIGEAYSHLQQYNKALKHQQIHLEVARKEKDPLEEQRALATIGHTYLTSYLDVIDNPDKTALNLAYKSFMKSLVICEKLTGINKREHMDMSTRLFANLGVVQESLGNYDKGIELLQKSIDICKSYDIYEQLQRGHMMMGSLYAKKEDYSNAIHQYNLAAEVASRLDDKTVLVSSALSAKADILIKLSDFYAAKTVLLKAHKMKNPNITDHLNTETILKTVAAMCYTEDSLLTTNATDYKTRKKLYEKMGDGASGLRNYPKAIEYYHKMLETAINDGESGQDLCPCYISLAQCYSDNKQYEKAIEYYQKEYSVNKNSAKEAVSTLFSIVDAMELARRPLEDKEEIYKVALKHCMDEGDTHLAGKTLIRHLNLLKKNNKSTNVSKLERDLIELNFVSSGSESEEETTPNVGVDICVDDITDVSDVSDGERDLNKPRAARKRNKGFIVKRNIKGETQLHTACISGNITLLRRLLDQGHPVNIRDNCGWLPIHEACICGHLEIVELLLNKGAAINDRGGTLCNGMTPLHDASSNGHLEVIQLLLDRGANATVKTDDGALPIHMLENWRKQNRLDTVQQSFYEVILERFKHTLEASGYDKDVYNCDKENVALVQEDSDEFEVGTSRAQRCKPALKIGALRRLQERDDTDQNKPTSSTVYGDESSSDVSTSTGSGDSNAKDEYKKVMKNLRHHIAKAKKNKSQKQKLTKRTALIELEDVGDDWLEDDIGINCKKQKLAAGDLINSVGARKTPMGGGCSKITRKRSSLKRYPSTDSHSNESVPEKFFDSDLEFESEKMEEDTRDIPNEILSLLDEDDNKSNFSQRKKRKKQISLIGAGFSRFCTSSSNDLNTCANVSASRNPKHQTKLTNFATVSNMVEADSTTSGASTSNLIRRSSDKIDSRNTMLNDPTLSVDVRIDGRLYRVPVPVSEMHTLTIKWLADEAAKRYCRKEFMKPTLELETKNGAVLAEDDLISIIFPMGNTQAEEVNARILKWNLPPLIERYKEACVNMNIDQNEDISKLLQDVSTTLNLSDLYLRKKALGPLCKALNRHTNLYHLNLSGNFMSTENIQLLCLSLPSLENLAILNLSLNHLVAESLDCMAKMFLESNRSILENLVSLDLSYNPLGNDSLKHLAIITRHLKLHTLNLSAVDFTDDIFSHFANKKLDLYLEYVENFDVSFNRLDKNQILKFISWLKPSNIGSLNVSRNNLTEDGLTSELINLFHGGADAQLNLTHLNLSGCRVTDSEMYQFLGLLPNVPNLQTLNLSYNSNVTAISLRRFIQHSMSLLHLDLTGCDDILKYFGSCEDGAWIMSENTNLQSLKLSVNKRLHNKECEMLINMWMNKYREKADVVDELRDFLELSIKS